MAIKTNQELAQELEKIIDYNGIKKIWLSEKWELRIRILIKSMKIPKLMNLDIPLIKRIQKTCERLTTVISETIKPSKLKGPCGAV